MGEKNILQSGQKNNLIISHYLESLRYVDFTKLEF